MAWSVKDNASRNEPCADSAICQIASWSAVICSFSRIAPRCLVISSTAKGRRVNCKHREITVIGNFCGSVVANKNLTCSGGSSSVFNNALKECVESICTSSIR